MTRQELKQAICEQLATAHVIPYLRVSPSGWMPVIAACHENVDRWVKETTDNAAVRGWIVYMPSVFADGEPAIILTAHSVVRDQDGDLYDITPLADERARPSCRFISHTGDEDSFWEMKREDIFVWCPDCHRRD